MSELQDLMPTAEALARVVQELRHGSIRIGVFGEFSSGKSTFLNALMGEDLLTVAVDPTTATPTRIEYARDFNIRVLGTPGQNGDASELARLFADKVPAWARFVGKSGILSVLRQEGVQIRSFLERWTKEGEDAARTSAVMLCLPQPFLKNRLCLIDTPGANNEFTRHHRITEQVAAQVDIAVCLIDGRQSEKRSGRDFVLAVAAIAPTTVLVINKIDCVDVSEREDVAISVQDAFSSAWPADKGSCPQPLLCSSKAVMDEALATAHPSLVTEFAAVRQHLTDRANSERGRLILHRTGGLDRTLRTLAGEAERIGQFDIAHRALEECLNLYREAEIEDADLFARFARIEKSLEANLPKVAEANALLELAERKLSEQNGVATADVRDVVLRATLIFREMNQTSERLEHIRRGMNRTPAETLLANLGDEVRRFDESIRSVKPDSGLEFLKSVSPEHWSLWKNGADAGVAICQVFMGCAAAVGIGIVAKDEVAAAAWFRNPAEQGHATAQFCLGFYYQNGLGLPQDLGEAILWYRKSAEQGEPEAQQALGQCYEQGLGVPMDAVQAVQWYRKAAEQGLAVAQNNLGLCLSQGPGLLEGSIQAVDWIRKAAEQGNATAQDNLGSFYEQGIGVAQNHQQAAFWFRKAAENGHHFGEFNLGMCFAHGHGVLQDYSQALYWGKKAAEAGIESAQYQMGVTFDLGLGVQQDISQAVAWYAKAAEAGVADAQHSLGTKYYQGSGVPQNYPLAVQWFRKAAEQNHAEGMLALGICYEFGHGVPGDFAQALSWYWKAADSGLADAQCRLGVYYYNDQGGQQDFALAATWFNHAAMQGNGNAQEWLGICFHNGQGVDRDLQQAIEWYKKAIASGITSAQKNLDLATEAQKDPIGNFFKELFS